MVSNADTVLCLADHVAVGGKDITAQPRVASVNPRVIAQSRIGNLPSESRSP